MIIKIGERIAELRNKRDLSQSALAKSLGVSRSSVNAWEMSISIPTIEKIIDIADYFKVSIDYLIGYNDKLTVDISNMGDTEKKYVYNLIYILENSQNNK